MPRSLAADLSSVVDWRRTRPLQKTQAIGPFVLSSETNYTFSMKTVKFRPELAQLIMDGKKTTTWRLFDDKDLQAGDEIELMNKATLQPFGRATISWVTLKRIKDLDDADWEGHERFPSEEAMYAAYREYYPGREVGSETVVKILHFEVIKN